MHSSHLAKAICEGLRLVPYAHEPRRGAPRVHSSKAREVTKPRPAKTVGLYRRSKKIWRALASQIAFCRLFSKLSAQSLRRYRARRRELGSQRSFPSRLPCIATHPSPAALCFVFTNFFSTVARVRWARQCVLILSHLCAQIASTVYYSQPTEIRWPGFRFVNLRSVCAVPFSISVLRTEHYVRSGLPVAKFR